MSDTSYTLDNLQVQSDIGHIRIRPGMYIGEAIDPRHLLVEAIDNAVDEAMNTEGTRIEVWIDTLPDSRVRYTVNDTGRGIPIGYKTAPDGVDRPSTELMTLFSKSGGKFDNEAFKIRGGLHGMGLSIIAALSDEVKIEVYNKDGDYMITEITHDPTDSSSENFMDEVGVSSEIIMKKELVSEVIKGTTISYIPSDKYFRSMSISRDFIIEKCKIVNANTDQCLDLYINGELVDTKATYKDLAYLEDNLTILTETTIHESDENGQSGTYWFSYTNDTTYSVRSIVNNIDTRDGGTHYTEIKNAIANAWWEYVKNNISDSDVDYTIDSMRKDDVTVGLYGVFSIMIMDPEFNSQNKVKLTNSKSDISEVMSSITKSIYSWLESDPDRSLSLFMRFVQYRKSKNKLADSRDLSKIIRINDDKGTGRVRRKSVVTKLKDCTNPGVEGTELLICEGNSASGPFERTRDRKTQAVLPLRGKIKNVSGMRLIDAIKSEEIANIINSIGSGAGDEDESDPTKSRYSKIIYISDADADGYHITALVANVFVRYMRPLVEAGMVYILTPPLYGYKDKGKRVYTSDLSDVPDSVMKSGKLTRYKGLGQMNDDELYETCVNPENRELYQLQYPENLDLFERILGTSSGRREIAIELGLLVKK